jgi:hypothetical protein
MAQAVYILCAATALMCAVLLLRAHRREPTPLLLWASLCFIALTANNVLLYVDIVVVPKMDLSLLRSLIALGGLGLLLYGLVWEVRQ